MSGRQLFVTDSFRGTGRPLLEILSDPKSIFMRGLAAFRRRTLYANIVNDRTAPFYTTAISAVDPYCDLRAVRLHYLKGYEDVILDPARPVSAAEPAQAPGRLQRLATGGRAIVARAPVAMLFGLLVPVALVVFLVNSGFQSVRSSRRIQLHEKGKAGIRIGSYRIPLMVEDVQTAMEEALNDKRPRPVHAGLSAPASSSSSTTAAGEGANHEERDGEEEEQALSAPGTSSPASAVSLVSSGAATAVVSDGVADIPTLALTPAQLRMVAALDALGFRKYPVHIHKDSHSHAAIIVRMPKESFSEGAVVMRHWLENEFDL
jgi:ribosomal protein L12E/L44/L45/RPP1/RPP2